MSLSYHPLCPVDVSVRVAAVHWGLALPVPLRHDPELIGHPVAVEPVPCLLILNQPIDSLKGAALWSDRSRGPRWASSLTSTRVCKKELYLHVEVKNQ
jgi:hypothetical protein